MARLPTMVTISPIALSVTEADLLEVLSEFSVSKIDINPENNTALVDFRNPYDPNLVISAMNNTQIGMVYTSNVLKELKEIINENYKHRRINCVSCSKTRKVPSFKEK